LLAKTADILMAMDIGSSALILSHVPATKPGVATIPSGRLAGGHRAGTLTPSG
jgi:hypothetical protein